MLVWAEICRWPEPPWLPLLSSFFLLAVSEMTINIHHSEVLPNFIWKERNCHTYSTHKEVLKTDTVTRVTVNRRRWCKVETQFSSRVDYLLQQQLLQQSSAAVFSPLKSLAFCVCECVCEWESHLQQHLPLLLQFYPEQHTEKQRDTEKIRQTAIPFPLQLPWADWIVIQTLRE